MICMSMPHSSQIVPVTMLTPPMARGSRHLFIDNVVEDVVANMKAEMLMAASRGELKAQL